MKGSHIVEDKILAVARRVVWFKSPEDALSDPTYFLCYLMQWGTSEDVVIAKTVFTETSFKDALTHAYPGILDKKSWAYWNLVYFGDPDRPLPSRYLG